LQQIWGPELPPFSLKTAEYSDLQSNRAGCDRNNRGEWMQCGRFDRFSSVQLRVYPGS